MLSTSSTLLHRLRRSSPEPAAWERFVELYTPVMLAWAQRLGVRDADAGDLLQDLFACLLVQLPSFEYDPSRSFRAWLKTLLLNRLRNLRRRRSPLYGADLDEHASPAVSDLDEREYREHLVARALKLMQSEFPDAVWRACWETVVACRAVSEVAAELGLSVNSVYLARSRVLRRLREELSGLLD